MPPLRPTLLLALTAAVYAQCPSSSWTRRPNTNTCYYVDKTAQLTFSQAQTYCRTYSDAAQLAVIGDDQINSFIRKLIKKGSKAWFALVRKRGQIALTLPDGGVPPAYTSWDRGEPKPPSRIEDQCAATDSHGLWSLRPCSAQKLSVCEAPYAVQT